MAEIRPEELSRAVRILEALVHGAPMAALPFRGSDTTDRQAMIHALLQEVSCPERQLAYKLLKAGGR